jgi:tight adherence protein B
MSDLAVVLIPSLLTAGVVLIVLGVTGNGTVSMDRPGRDRRLMRRLRDWMAQAGASGASAGQLLALCLGLGLLAGLPLLGLTGSAPLVAAFAVLTGYLPVLALRARQRRRTRELREVWPDAIDHLVSAVRAGLSLPEAVAALAERGPQALREPFARFAIVYHATGRFGHALDQLKAELADHTADRVVEALRVAREVGGGELGRILRTLSGFLRDEHRVRKELEARQTWVLVAARMSFATPWLVLLLLATKPEALAAYRGAGGAVVLAVGAAMATVGYRLMLVIGRLPSEERVLR